MSVPVHISEVVAGDGIVQTFGNKWN